jgi:hypothetical protein
MRMAAMIAVAAVAGACKGGRAPASDAGTVAAAPTEPSVSVRREPPLRVPGSPSPLGSSQAALQARLPCRAIAADGDVRIESGTDAGATPLTSSSEIPVEAWLLLGKDARLVAKDPRTTRETTFLGPGRFRACVNLGEESWASAGSFESVVGAGESPGAEEWVVTPEAVVRYAAASLHVDASPQGTRLRLANGVAFLWPPQGEAAAEGWQRVTAAETTIPGPSRTDGSAAATAVDRCALLAARSQELARALLAPPDGGPGGGNVAAEQVTARRLARAACALAALRVDSLSVGETSRKDALSAKVRAAEIERRALPLAGSTP